MASIILPPIPTSLNWKNQPAPGSGKSGKDLLISAGPTADWFTHPSGISVKRDAPVLLFSSPDEDFLLAARVTVAFGAKFDAGVLFAYENDNLWAKLCLEYSPEKDPTIVSVVTRGTSDDCNSVPIARNEVYLRIYRQNQVLAFHYSEDGSYWNLVRHFALGPLQSPQFGFSAQSPVGQGCTVRFSEISYRPGRLSDIRNGA